MAMEIGEVSVSAQFNYLDKTPAREWIVVTDKGTFRADLTAHFAADTTRLMHEAILSGSPDACTYEEGLAVNRLIDGLEA